MAVNAVMQVWSRAPRIARVADVAQHIAGGDHVTRAEGSVTIEVRVIVPFQSRSEHTHDLTAKAIRANTGHNAMRRASDRRALGRKQIDSFVMTSARSCRSPGVRDPRRRTADWIRQLCWDRIPGERIHEPRPLESGTQRRGQADGERTDEHREDKKSLHWSY